MVAGLLAISMNASTFAESNPCAPKATVQPQQGTKNPCAAKNPCVAKHPCAAKNPCAAMNPCAAGDRVDPGRVTRPSGTRPYQGNQATLLDEGKALWNSKAISGNHSIACSSCHQDGTEMLQPAFAKPYPHLVQMVADDNGMKSISLEGMVQYCMIKPMQSKPFTWDSRQLAALTAYTAELQKNSNQQEMRLILVLPEIHVHRETHAA